MATDVLSPVPNTQSQDAPGRMTYEEFLDWANEDTHAEWVNGEVIFMSPVSNTHQEVSRLLYPLILDFVQTRRLGVVCNESFQMKTAPHLPGREPDILFVANENLSRLKENLLEGPADLVVEIVSPGGNKRDRGDKFDEYEEGGVQEYWVIDPYRSRAEFYQLDAGGVFRQLMPDAEGNYRSRALNGFRLNVEWLWRTPIPTFREVLSELGSPLP